MAVDIQKLKDHKEAGDKKAFNDILVRFLPNLKKVISFKLKQMEKQGLIKKNMYSAQEIVDEVYLRLFENFNEDYLEESFLKIRMFQISKEILEELTRKKLDKTIPVDKIVADELKELNEEYTVDADGDFVMIEELDDISYHLDDYKEHILLLDTDNVEELAQELDITGKDEKLTEEQSIKVNSAFSNLPEISQSVITHIGFGKLSISETAKVHSLPVEVVTEIYDKVKDRIKNLLK